MVPPDKPADSSKRKHRGVRLAEAYFQAKKDKHKDAEAYKWAREDLAGYCLKHMTMLVRVSVYGSRFYPRSHGAEIFAEDCTSTLHEKYTEGIDTLEIPENLHAFLRITVRHAMIDRLVYYVRRPQESLERMDEEGQEIQKLDEEGRDAAVRDLPASLGLLAEGDKWAKAIENRDLLKKALAQHVSSGDLRDAESGLWIENTWENPKIAFGDIANARKTSVRSAYRFLEEDNEAVMKIAKKLVAQERESAEMRVS